MGACVAAFWLVAANAVAPAQESDADYRKRIAEIDQTATSARQAMRSLGDGAVGALIEALKSNDDSTRRNAAHALASIQNPDCVPAMIVAAETDSVLDVRREALVGLRRMADLRALPALVRLLEDGETEIREAAAEALGDIRGRRASHPLTITMAQDPSAVVRADAALALMKISDRRTVPALLVALRDPDLNVRAWAGHALGRIKADVSVPKVALLLDDPDPKVRFTTAQALGVIGGDDTIAPLIKAANDADAEVRKIALQMLARSQDVRARPVVEKRLTDESTLVQEAAIEAVVDLKHVAAIKILNDLAGKGAARIAQRAESAIRSLEKLK